jgi:pimeloyl-ACP methyl ester carboxylesterase
MYKKISWLLIIFNLLACCVNHNLQQIGHKEHSALYTSDGARLKLVSSNASRNLNIVFLPGGPGVGSSYFTALTDKLDINANLWLLDLPDNGDNLKENVDFTKWSKHLVRAIDSLDNVIIVGHSFGGMLILSEPEISQHVKAIILLNSSPIPHFAAAEKERIKYNLPSLDKMVEKYAQNPSNETQKELAIAAADYYFTPGYKERGKELLRQGAYNHRPLDWGLSKFFAEYKSFVPTVPTLIIGADQDHITPLYSFKEDLRYNTKPHISIVEIKDAGHFPIIEKPEEVRRTIKEFVRGL